jgi:hypothetical protein
MSAKYSSPTAAVSIRPTFGSASVSVAVASMWGVPATPVVTFSPLGVSRARMGAGCWLAYSMSVAAGPVGSPLKL